MGPSVVATAFESVSTPRSKAALPSTPNLRSLCANLCCCKLNEEAPSRDRERGLESDDADGNTEARALEVNARCILTDLDRGGGEGAVNVLSEKKIVAEIEAS